MKQLKINGGVKGSVSKKKKKDVYQRREGGKNARWAFNEKTQSMMVKEPNVNKIMREMPVKQNI